MAPASSPRTTRQRLGVEEGLKRAGGFRTAQELHEELRRRGLSIGLTTVYRSLQRLAASGRVDCIRTAAGELTYGICSRAEHHHHLVCTNCGKSIEIADERVETWTRRTAAKHGFTDVRHELEIFGVCRRCTS